MQLVDMDSSDIKLDSNGQPVVDIEGDFELVFDRKCFQQDLRNEILTEQAELFYEDEDELDSYGFGLLEFIKDTYSDFVDLEIEQRINEKLRKREEIESASIQTNIITNEYGIIKIRIHFRVSETDEEYDVEISENKVEVVKE